MNGAVSAQPEEKILYAKLQNQAEFCELRQKSAFSDFLDPLRCSKFSALLAKDFNISLFSFGGYDKAERKMIGFFSDESISVSDFPIEALEISYNSRFSKSPTHRDYLGSLIGLGIERTKIGDILPEEGSATVFVNTSISGYIIANLETVGRVKVKVAAKEFEKTQQKEEEKIIRFTVASLRLDVLVSAAFHISRGKAAELIKAEKVFVNWVSVTNASKNLKEGDMITLRGYGRMKLQEVIAETKKGRLAVSISLS